jgi:hypothetical protein
MQIHKLVTVIGLVAGFALVSTAPGHAFKFKPGKAFKSVTRTVGKIGSGAARTAGKGAKTVGKGARAVGKAYVKVVKTGATYSYKVGKKAALAPGRNIQTGYRVIKNGPKTLPRSLRATYRPPRLR